MEYLHLKERYSMEMSKTEKICYTIILITCIVAIVRAWMGV